MAFGIWGSWIWLFLILSSDWDCIIPDRSNVNLGVLLDSQYLFKEQLVVVVQGGFAQLHIVHQLSSFLDQEILGTVIRVQLSLEWTTQWTLHDAALEKHSETSVAPECSGMSNYGYVLSILHLGSMNFTDSKFASGSNSGASY